MLAGLLEEWFGKVLDTILNVVSDDNFDEIRYYYQIENIFKQFKEEYQEILTDNIQDYYIMHSETVEAITNNKIAQKTVDSSYLLSIKDDEQINLDDWLYTEASIDYLQEQVKRKLRFSNNVQTTLNRYLPQHIKYTPTVTQFTRAELLEYEIDQAVIEYMSNNIFTASESTLARVTQEVYDIIKQSYGEEGNGVNTVTEEIQDRFNELKRYEAQRIARTETLKAQGNATHQRLVNNPDVEYIQWIATDDDRTRESHAELNGEITYADGSGIFSNGLKHVGDTDGDIEEWINCRCDEVAYIAEAGFVPPQGAENWYEDEMLLDTSIDIPEVYFEMEEYLASFW